MSTGNEHTVKEIESIDFFIAQNRERINQIEQNIAQQTERRDYLFSTLPDELKATVKKPDPAGVAATASKV
jgi:hypothetical protein